MPTVSKPVLITAPGLVFAPMHALGLALALAMPGMAAAQEQPGSPAPGSPKQIAPAEAGPAQADPAPGGEAVIGADTSCSGVDLYSQDQPSPRLFTVAPAGKRVHFLKGGGDTPGCPGADASCAAKAFVVAGDSVVVSRLTDAHACATFLPASPKGRPTVGWLPREALQEAAAAGSAQWPGRWSSHEEQTVVITPADKGQITIDGNALWGAEDPERVKNGAVNEGAISATVTPEQATAAFALGIDGAPTPVDRIATDDVEPCRVRLWQLGPYLVVADNVRCGGANVTFTGVYRREAAVK